MTQSMTHTAPQTAGATFSNVKAFFGGVSDGLLPAAATTAFVSLIGADSETALIMGSAVNGVISSANTQGDNHARKVGGAISFFSSAGIAGVCLFTDGALVVDKLWANAVWRELLFVGATLVGGACCPELTSSNAPTARKKLRNFSLAALAVTGIGLGVQNQDVIKEKYEQVKNLITLNDAPTRALPAKSIAFPVAGLAA